MQIVIRPTHEKPQEPRIFTLAMHINIKSNYNLGIHIYQAC